MKVLVLNCGSSSVKYQLIETSLERIQANTDRPIARGAVERIGTSSAIHTYRPEGGEKASDVKEILEHRVAIADIVRTLTRPENGVIREVREIDAVGHRNGHEGLVRHTRMLSERVPARRPPVREASHCPARYPVVSAYPRTV